MLLELEEGGFAHYFTSEVLGSLGHGTAVWAAPKFRLAQGGPASWHIPVPPWYVPYARVYGGGKPREADISAMGEFSPGYGVLAPEFSIVGL